MRKLWLVGMSVGVVLLFSTFSWAGLKMGGSAGYYSPNFGEINEMLADLNTHAGTDFEFKGGIIYGIDFGYDINPRFGLRVEYNSFASNTADSFSAYIHWPGVPDDILFDIDAEFELTTTPLILSVVYLLSPQTSWSPYVGAGIGTFPSRFRFQFDYQGDGTQGSISQPYDDSPIGFQALGGIRKDLTDNLVFNGEVRYISAKATFEDTGSGEAVTDIDCDWSGFMGNLGIEYRFP